MKWFKDEKGSGRILGDDDYLYFVIFSEIHVDGYRSLREGQRVRFKVSESVADHGRAAASAVHPLDG